MKRRLALASLLVFLFLLLVPAQAKAQTPPFPQVGQNWTYHMTGHTDFDSPIDVTIDYETTIKYSVVGVEANRFMVVQEVTGTPIWPSQTGSGSIVFVNTESTPWDYNKQPSNESFSFTTTGYISLNDSLITGLGGDEVSVVYLNWTDGLHEVWTYVGLTWLIWFIFTFHYPVPPLFLTRDCHTIVWWNTSWAPWGSTLSGTGAPTMSGTNAWTAEALATPLGVRQAWKNATSINVPHGDVDVTTWIDQETGILLKLTDEVHLSDVFDFDLETTVELVSCDFFGILGYLMYTKFFGISLLYIVIAGVVLLVIIFLLLVICLKRRK